MAEKLQNLVDLYAYDMEKRLSYPLLCGVDEAGRGPLAGDVYAAAVILSPEHLPEGLNDSKKLTEKKREQLFPQIQKMAVAYCIATASVEEIAEYNILGATMLAMQRAVSGLSMQPDYVLIDGNRMPKLSIAAETVVKGDATSATIAAASILAKVARDHYLLELDAQYPQYGFAKHKGYGTKAHCEAILQYGASPVHRKAFLRKLLHETDNN
ncbi:MAG: ribonuclease HII [Oscillospiraceae bacterium]|nr:ribonuclease HII [Oscillospiraceae bacterium]